MIGVATSAGVESSVRSAYDYGYNVVAVVDAMTDRDAEAHRHSVEKIFPRMCEYGYNRQRAEGIEGGVRLASSSARHKEKKAGHN